VSTSAATPNKSASKDPQFWDLVIKLDQSKNKSSKLISQKSTSSQTNLFTGPGGGISQAIPYDDTDVDFNIENSPLARLMIMLENSVLKSNSSLMDKMFTCLAHASAGIPLSENTSTTVDSENKGYENEAVLSKQIQLVVDVLKNKACTQDGLNQAYALLNNLSKINGATRNLIISHLLDGTRELGYAVCQEIDTLLEEALQYKPSEPVNPPTTTQTEDKHIIDSYPTTAGGEGGDEDTSDSLMNSNLPGTSYELMQQSTLQNFIDRYSNLVISSPKAKQVRELQLPSMSKLVEKNSNQKFFVRLIKLIINLRDAIEKEAKKKRQQLMQQQARSAAIAATIATTTHPAAEAQSTSETPSNDDQNKGEQKKAEVLNRLSSELDLDSLWNKLSQCLSVLKSLSDPYAVLILQQTVEAFFYVHSTKKDKEETRKKEKETKEAQLAHLDSEYPMSPAAGSSSTTGTTEIANANMEIQSLLNTIGNESPDTKKFLEFALTHRTVLNHILRQTSNNLSDEPYSVLIEFCRLHPSILDFDVKRRYFRQELDKLKDNIRGEDLAVHVKRSNVFDDSYRELNRRTADDWKHRFYIVFEGEEGQDAGGLLREWYLIISKEIFNPDYALFMINPGDRVTYMPNPSSHFNPNHLSYFRFIGRIIAKAIFDNKFLDCYFTRAFYKHILGVPVKYTDMESVDNEFYKNLVSIIESDIDTLGVDLAFSIDINEFGVTQSRDLKPTGHNIRVTNENKSEYIRLVCQEKMIGSIRQQVASFLHGFYEIIPKNLISIFNEQELELLISGLPEIDLEDLKRNTEYHKYTSSSLQVKF
jgi:E3 ubiquitin-protein ligase HUWE1